MSNAPRRVDDALQEVGRWRGEQRARHEAEVGQVEDHIASLHEQIAALQQAIEQAEAEKVVVQARGSEIDDQMSSSATRRARSPAPPAARRAARCRRSRAASGCRPAG